MKKRLPSRGFLMAMVAAVAFPVIYINWRERTAERAKPQPYAFPVAELAALDRDLQARFAVVPTRDFGMSRIGALHDLYVPENAAEKQTVEKLRKARLRVAFYVMSRRTWRNERGAMGNYPIQGPVYITNNVTAPLPRKNPFSGGSRKPPRIEEPPEVSLNTPGGSEVQATPLPDGLPEGRWLREVGDKVFEDSEFMPLDFRAGVNVGAGAWNVAAVPVRASDQACVKCHNMSGWSPSDKPIKIGDVVGVAMYAFQKSPPKGLK